MPSLIDLLDPEQAARLTALPTTPVARECECPSTSDGFSAASGEVVHIGCGNPRLGVANLRGAVGRTVTVPCAGSCGERVTVVVRKPKPEDADKVRLPVCQPCAITMTAGKSGSVRRPSVRPTPSFARQALFISNVNEEPHVPVNLDTMSDAELGAHVRTAMQERIAADLPAKNKAAKAKKGKKDKAAKKAKRAERVDLSGIGVLPGFVVKGVEIPDLDVSDIAMLDEAVPPKVRSPYNKARYRLKQDLLPSATAAQIKDDPTTPQTTWAALIGVHQELAVKAENVAEAVTEKAVTEEPKKAKAVIAAAVNLDEKARVNVLRETFGVDKKTARKMLAEIGA